MTVNINISHVLIIWSGVGITKISVKFVKCQNSLLLVDNFGLKMQKVPLNIVP